MRATAANVVHGRPNRRRQARPRREQPLILLTGVGNNPCCVLRRFPARAFVGPVALLLVWGRPDVSHASAGAGGVPVAGIDAVAPGVDARGSADATSEGAARGLGPAVAKSPEDERRGESGLAAGDSPARRGAGGSAPATASSVGRDAATAASPVAIVPRRVAYWSRPVSPSPRFIDHGVLQAGVAGGIPHKYRLEVGLGLFDHLSLAVTAHWLPGHETPKLSPRVAIAFWRWTFVSIGAWHHWTLYPQPVVDLDLTTPSYQRTAQWFLGTMSFGQRWVSGGFDAGVVRVREDDPGADPGPDLRNPSRTRVRFGGGIFARVGTRRWGLTAQMLLPALVAEIALDLRFGLFEARPRGGWLPRDKLGSGGAQRRPWSPG